MAPILDVDSEKNLKTGILLGLRKALEVPPLPA
jgi:hypothetical protein